MKIRGCLLSAAVLAGVPGAAFAEDVKPLFTIYGGYSHLFADSERNSDDGIGFFVGGGVPISRYFNVDFSAYHHDLGGETGVPDTAENGFKTDFLFYYSRNRAFSPYVGIGAGLNRTRNETTGDTEDDTFFDAGVGFQTYPFFDGKLGLMGDVRYRWLDTDAGGSSTIEDVVARAGFVVPFGTVKAAAPVVAPVAKPKPAEKQPEPVQLELERRFTDVLFDFDKSDIKPAFSGILDDAAKTINQLSEQNANVRVKVDGHTDWIGTDGYNMGLGERRAGAVKQYLIRKGVAADRIDTTSYGESKPVATNETAEGRQLNRRTEIRTTAEQ